MRAESSGSTDDLPATTPNQQLYIFTHPETKAWVRYQIEHMLAERNPPLTPA